MANERDTARSAQDLAEHVRDGMLRNDRASKMLGMQIVEVAPGHATLVVDMSQTQFCDSAGLNVLVRAHQRAEARGGQVRLVISMTHVRRIVTVTGIDRVIPSFPSLEQALAPATAPAIHPPAAG